MNRSARKHRSSKVPNVKLRPAPLGSSKRNERLHAEAEAEREDLAHYRRLREAHRTGKGIINNSGEDDNSEVENDDNEGNDDDRDPLLGCVICMTGIGDEKATLSEYAVMLGAQVQGNLTEDATHLIANETGSEKYKCALKLGLPILRSEWLRELRARWTEAVHYDFEGLMEEHRLDTFENSCVALAGITDPLERTDLRKSLKSGSAKTPTTFSLDGSFTHLICGDIKDSKTMEVVKKYRKKAERFLRRGESLPAEGEVNSTEMRAAINLRIVWKEWVEDCLEVQGSIDEHFYAIEEPRLTLSQRKELKEAMLHERSQRVTLNRERMTAARRIHDARDGKRVREEVSETQNRGQHEVQRVTKKPKVDINKYVQQISKGDAEERKDDASNGSGEVKSFQGLSMARSLSFAEMSRKQQDVIETTSVASPHRIQIDDERDLADDDEPGADNMDDDEDDNSTVLEEDPASGLHSNYREKSLSSLTFRIDLHNEERNQAARRALQTRGVQSILDAQDPAPAHFHILPLGRVDSPRSSNSTITDTTHLGTPVTHLFIERCLFESRVLSLHESFALQPSAVEFPIPGAENVFVGMTGFAAEDDIDRKQLEIALRSAGIESSSTLKRGLHTHLLLGKEAENSESSRMKIQKAKEWGIHCVGLDFVHRIYKQGQIEPAAKKIDRIQNLLDRSGSRGASMGVTLGETQGYSTVPRRQPDGNQQVSKVPLNTSRPWQRSASGSQALLDGEESRGVIFRGTASRYQNVESLEAGSLAIKTSADEVMALLSNRHQGDVASSAVSSSSARKRGRLPPSRLKERRSGSAILNRDDRVLNEAPTVEDLLAAKKEEEDRQMIVGPTQMSTQFNQSSAQENESMRITYDDPSSRRERRKIGELIATSVKHLKARQENEETDTNRGSSTETEEELVDLRSSSASPCKPRTANTSFVPSIQARRQPGTSYRYN